MFKKTQNCKKRIKEYSSKVAASLKHMKGYEMSG